MTAAVLKNPKDSLSTQFLPNASKTAALPMKPGVMGKYREIIIAVGFFLLFDLGVLVLNFYTSFQIGEDAKAINLAGRQRMLTQRTTKAIYAVQDRIATGQSLEADGKELATAVRLFDDTLRAFRQGGTVTGGDGKPVTLARIEDARALEALDQAQKAWDPLYIKVKNITIGSPSLADVLDVSLYARENNVKLLGLMNQLTTALESGAEQRAANLRMVQTVGIVLALLNFVFILFKFLRRLRISDQAIEQANEENREILSSVREGLFLMTPDLKLGSQIANSVSALFGRVVRPGDGFLSILQPLVNERTLDDARNYVGLLFSPHVKESLVQTINPLGEVTIRFKGTGGNEVERHLSFNFNRVMDEGLQKQVRHLLVTVQDISPRMELEKKIKAERSRAEKEFSMLLRAVETEPTTLRMFVDRSEAAMLEVNDLLRSISDASSSAQIQKAIDTAFRRVHAFKGEASSLGLDVLAQIAHVFENSLHSVRQQPQASSDMLLALPLPLEDLLSKIGTLKKLASSERGRASEKNQGATLDARLEALATQVAKDEGKQVMLDSQLASMSELKEAQTGLLSEILTQLVRNSVVHGIELPEQRQLAGKSVAGKIELSLVLDAVGNAELVVRDDGVGLSVNRVRQRLLKLAWYDEAQLAQLSERQVMAHIFKPGFSTSEGTSMHAGRGVGLDVVQANVERLGGQLLVSTAAGAHTTFKIRFGL
jgi:two-component system, chemotaxis family, sensor kinase CheA